MPTPEAHPKRTSSGPQSKSPLTSTHGSYHASNRTLIIPQPAPSIGNSNLTGSPSSSNETNRNYQQVDAEETHHQASSRVPVQSPRPSATTKDRYEHSVYIPRPWGSRPGHSLSPMARWESERPIDQPWNSIGEVYIQCHQNSSDDSSRPRLFKVRELGKVVANDA